MSFKIQIVSVLYQQYLTKYYEQNNDIIKESYQKQYNHLLNDTSELVGLYTRNLNKSGVNTSFIITNACALQTAWKKENNVSHRDKMMLVYEQVKTYNPDILWIEDIKFLSKDWINNVRKSLPNLKLIMASHCAPYNNRLLEDFENMDFVITCTPGLNSFFKEKGINSYLVYHGFDKDILDKVREDKDFQGNDFVFSGSLFTGCGYHSKRIEYIEEILKSDLNLKIYGNFENKFKIIAKQIVFYIYRLFKLMHLEKSIISLSVFGKAKVYKDLPVRNYSKKLKQNTEPAVFGLDMYKLLKNAKITLNMHGEIAGEYAGNVRLFEATGLGTCLLTEKKKNLPELFNCDTDIVVYDGIEDCINKVKWLLQNEEKRKEIARNGRLKTLKSHTIEDRCKQIIGIIQKELGVLK